MKSMTRSCALLATFFFLAFASHPVLAGRPKPHTASVEPNDDSSTVCVEPNNSNTKKRYFASLPIAGWLSKRFERMDTLDKGEIHEIGTNLRYAIHWVDILMLVLIGWGIMPLFRIVFVRIGKSFSYPFEESYMHLVASILSQGAKLSLIVLVTDAIVIILDTIHFAPFSHLTVYSQALSKILFLLWITRGICHLKRYLLGKAASKNPEKLGLKLGLTDRLLDLIIYGASASFLVDILDVDVGLGLGSMFAMSSGVTLILGFASQDAAKAFVSGLVLSTSNRVDEGDEVRFGDGTSGFIQKIGWIQTTIRGYDNLTSIIPNSELGGLRVVNISRAKMCQVALKLRFKMKYGEVMEKLCQDIKEEIKKSCPQVITDGSKPFRAVWTDYQDDHLEVQVNTHYELPPVGDVYWNNRKEVMKAIYRAVNANGVEFQIRAFL